MSAQTPTPWLVTYQHERRKHRHRCQGCWRPINTGEQAFMAKVANRKTRAVHAICASKLAEPDSLVTVHELLATHQIAYLNKSLTGDQALAAARTALALSQPEKQS